MADHPTFTTRLTWTGQQLPEPVATRTYTTLYEIGPEGKPVVPGAAPPAYGGDGARYNPEDFMLASLTSCHMLTFLAVAAKSRVIVLGYRDTADAALGMKDGKLRMVDALLRPHVVVGTAEEAGRLGALHEKAHANCFMANSVNFTVRIEPTFEVKA